MSIHDERCAVEGTESREAIYMGSRWPEIRNSIEGQEEAMQYSRLCRRTRLAGARMFSISGGRIRRRRLPRLTSGGTTQNALQALLP